MDKNCPWVELKEKEVDRLQAKRKELSKILSELQEVVDFNNRMLEEKGVTGVLETENGSQSSKTNVLLKDKIVCWTCGTEVEPDSVTRR